MEMALLVLQDLQVASGTAGTSGVAGTSGSAGTSGATGTSGSSGTSASSEFFRNCRHYVASSWNSWCCRNCRNLVELNGAVGGYLGSFYDTTNQTGVAGAVLTMGLNNSDSWNNGVSLVSGSQITIANPGVYNLHLVHRW
jgi:hypothetical protein